MTDSHRLLRICGWVEYMGIWHHAVHGTCTEAEALKHCRATSAGKE